MARYRVILSSAAQRQIEAIRGPAFLALRGVILALAADPRPQGAGKLRGRKDLWRRRFRIDGRPWRVVYRLDSKARTVIVTRVVRRDEGSYRRSGQARQSPHP